VVRSTKPVVTATVTAKDGSPAAGGTVTVYVDGENRGSGSVSDGTARVQLPAFTTTGSKRLVVEYTGVDRATNDSSTSLPVSVVRATPDMQVLVQPDDIRKKKTKPVLHVSLSAPEQVVSGYVLVRQGRNVLGYARLTDGRAAIVLPPFSQRGDQLVEVDYLGSDLAEPVSKDVTITVRN
jgi:hypothetical protein